MTRIVTYAHRPKRPPRKQPASPLPGPAVVTRRATPNTGKPKAEPTVTARKPSKLRGEPVSVSEDRSAAAPAAIVTTPGRKQPAAADAPHLPMELPLSRQPVERAGGDYKRMKASMTRRLRGDDE
jgi:hypothetical protein